MTGNNKLVSSISLASAIGLGEAGTEGHLLSDLDACRAAAESSRARVRLHSEALNKTLSIEMTAGNTIKAEIMHLKAC